MQYRILSHSSYNGSQALNHFIAEAWLVSRPLLQKLLRCRCCMAFLIAYRIVYFSSSKSLLKKPGHRLGSVLWLGRGWSAERRNAKCGEHPGMLNVLNPNPNFKSVWHSGRLPRSALWHLALRVAPIWVYFTLNVNMWRLYSSWL